MTNRRGLDYRIETSANLAGLDAFTKKIGQVKSAWDDLKKSSQTLKLGATKGNLESIGKQVPKLKAVAKYLRDINKSLGITQTRAKKSAAYMRLIRQKTDQARVATTKLAKATRSVNSQLKGSAQAATTLGDRLKRAVAISGRILAIYAGFQLVKGVIDGLRDAVVSAFKFTDSIQKAEIGIRSLLVTMLDVRDAQGNLLDTSEAFAKSTAEAKRQTSLLRQEGLRTAATFQQLVDTYQVALGPGLAAGLDLDQIRKVTVLVSQAASAIGVPQDQLSEEIRALFTGSGSERTTRIAKQVLGISREAILSAREAGDLMTLLEDRLGTFGESGAATLETLSAQLINLGDIAKQSIGQGLLGSFEKIKDVAKQLNAFLGQGDDGIIQLNPEVIKVFNEVDSVISSIVDSAVDFAQSLDLDSILDGMKTLRFLTSAVFDVFSTLAKVVGNVAGALFFVVSSAVKLLKALGLVVNGSLIWETTLKAVEVVLTVILAHYTLIGLKSAFHTGQLIIQKGLYLAHTALIKANYAAMSLMIVFTDGLTAALARATVAAKGLRTLLATIALPLTTLLASLLLLVTFVDKELGPQLRNAFKHIWEDIVHGFKVTMTVAIGEIQKMLVQAKSLFGLSLGTTVDLERAVSLMTTLADLVSRQKAIEGIEEQAMQYADLGREIESVQKVIDDLANSSRELTKSEALNIVDEDVQKRLEGIVRDAADDGGNGFKEAFEVLAQKFNDIFDFGDDIEQPTDLVVFTSKFNEAKNAYDVLIKTSEKANQVLALNEAQFGMEGIQKTAEKLSQDLDISVEKVVNLGLVLAQDLKSKIDNLESIDVLSEEQQAELNAYVETLKAVEAKLLGIQTTRDSILGTQLAGQAQADKNARELRIIAAQEEIATVREVNRIRQELISRQISQEEAATRIKLVQAERAHDLTIQRLERESQFLLAQSQLAKFLGDDGKVLFEAGVAALEEIDVLNEKHKQDLFAITEEIRKQNLLRNDPQAFGEEEFLASLGSKQSIIAQGTEKLLNGFRTGLVNTLGDSLVDALFSKENTLREKWEALMQDLVSIMIKSFLEAQFVKSLLGTSDLLQGPNPDGTAGVVAKAGGGKIPGKGLASMAHFGRRAQAFNKGGRPAGIPASDTVPAWLTPGEWVTKLSSARMYGDKVMNMINDGAINPVALRALAGASHRSTATRKKAFRLSATGYASGGSVASGTRSGGNTTVLNTIDEDSVAVLLAGKAGERVIHNHLLSLGVIV